MTSRSQIAAGQGPALRVITKDQLARALHARTSHIIIWDIELARPFARLLWAERRQYHAFVDFLTDSMSREYGVKFGSEWKVGLHIAGQIILTPGDPEVAA
jgi:hypothetical protein